MSSWRAAVDADCTICRSDGREPAYLVDGHHVVRCTRCRHLYVSPRPPMDEVVAIYGPDYFENPAFKDTDHDAYFGYMDYLQDRDNIQAKLRQVLGRIERHHPKGRLLDIGCGPGLFVDVAQRDGWDAWGVDLNESAVQWAQANVSAQVQLGTASDLGAASASFDCVTMFDVIEHLADPRAELQEVWRVVKPGGILVVVTPNAGALVSRALGSHWLEMKRAPEHLQFFSVPGLAQLLALCGFRSIEWHSIGKVTTVRNILADLRFYSDGFFRGVERALDRVGLADRVFDVDPRTKVCLYARKSGPPAPLELYDARPAPKVKRVRRPSIDRAARDGSGAVGGGDQLRRHGDVAPALEAPLAGEEGPLDEHV